MTDSISGSEVSLTDPLDATPETLPATSAAAAGSTKDPLYLVAYCVMAAIIAVGLVGNLIVLYVYAKKKDGHAANVFIISLAVSDLIACCLVIPMSIAMEVNDYVSSALACKLYYLLNCSGIPFSSMLMAAIAVERYFCICRPFLRAITVPRAKAIVLTLGSVAFSLGLAIAVFCSVVVRRVEVSVVNGTESSALEFADYGECREISELKRSLANESSATAARISVSDASIVFFNIFQKVHLSLFGLCIALVFALYVRIYASVLRLRRQRRQRRQNQQQLVRLGPGSPPDNSCCAEDQRLGVNGGDGPDNAAAEPQPAQQRSRRKSLRLVDSDALQNLKTAAMLFVVTIVFTGTFIPAALMIIKVIGFNVLIFYLYYLTHATNPLIYCFMNRNFREDLRKMFCPETAQRRQQRRRQQQEQQQQQQQQRLLPVPNAVEDDARERRESIEASRV